MKKLATLILMTTLINFGCDRESIEPINRDIIAQFKVQTAIQFEGNVLNEDIYWRFDNWNNGIGTYCESFLCVTEDKIIQQRNFSIYDYQERKNLTFLKIVSPAFSINDAYESKKSVFGLGKKKFQKEDGSIYEGFIVQGNTKDICFSTKQGDQSNSSFEVIKIEELGGEFKRIRLWSIVSCTLYDCNGEKAGQIKNGRFLSEIEIERNE